VAVAVAVAVAGVVRREGGIQRGNANGLVTPVIASCVRACRADTQGAG
jgi:hypothetical protein